MEFYFNRVDHALSLEKALSLEWIETNGLGGYASSSILNCHTRKYHGFLVCNLRASTDRWVLLSKTEDTLIINQQKYLLTASQYPNYFQDGCFDHYRDFTLHTHPQCVYQFDQALLSKEILMPYLENRILIKYKLKQCKEACITIRPFFALRPFHCLAKEKNNLQYRFFSNKNTHQFQFYNPIPPLFAQTNQESRFLQEPLWYHHFEYLEENKRGYDFTEDLFSPGVWIIPLKEKEPFILSFGMNEDRIPLEEKWENEIIRRRNKTKKTHGSPLQKQLKKTSRSFIKKDLRDSSFSVIAGYHWFGEWGRDTMIALPGLTLYNNLDTLCLKILKKFSRNEYKGLIPNFLGKTQQENAYNSVDASLWFVWAVQQYYLKTNNIYAIEKHIWPTLKNIFLNYKKGTLHHIQINKLGLIEAGNKQINLTWMDAIVNEHPSTPRYGMAVEINALWFNALCFMEEFSERIHDSSITKELALLIKQVKTSFRSVFWNEQEGYLYDFVNDTERNASIRPNQIFALSLPYSPITKKIGQKIMKVVNAHLYTPYGLRTLSNKDPHYKGRYQGYPADRDQAYHSGTVWPWLLCHFAEAMLAVFKNRLTITKRLKENLLTLSAHLSEQGLGTISEVFDGDAPHLPNGCISQAWSVAEILRLTYLLEKQTHKEKA